VSDAGQLALLAAQTASATKNWKLTLPNGKVASFAGYVKQTADLRRRRPVGQALAGLKITGPVTWA
jgi:hypothetical protein